MEVLSQRKKKILKALVDDYIDNAQPVSSKELQSGYDIDCSSATIRNELSALESMGYLVQPHTSAGRVPSERAFKFYVDELMIRKPLTSREIAIITKKFNSKLSTLEEVVSNVANVLSEITNYTSVVVKATTDKEIIRKINVVQIGENSALVIVVTDSNLYKDNIINLPHDVDENMLIAATNWLNKLFAGSTLSEFSSPTVPLKAIYTEFQLFNKLYLKVIEVLRKVSNVKDSDVFTQGVNKIFEYPEYSDLARAKAFVTKLEDKDNLVQLFENEQSVQYNIKVGTDEFDMPIGCSIVSAKISIGDKSLGTAGVIGPMRMNYNKVISVLEHISKLVDKILLEETDE